MSHVRRSRWLSPLLLFVLAGCSIRDAACGRQPERPLVLSDTQAAELKGEAPPVHEVAFLGDSLTAGYGLLQNEAYPALVARELETDGYSEIAVVNAGVTGDTSAGGLARLEWVLEPSVRILVVALGANDAMRGTAPGETKSNLSRIITTAKSTGRLVVLLGMEAPPNLGDDYRATFRAIYRDLSSEHGVPLVPFMLDGVAGVPSLNQDDGIHPTAEGQRLIAALVYPVLRPVIDDLLSR
ncbi:MAG: arylesterase [Acidimicrobiia bacterium]|nr:arylesterase [Acidimicrobiia bacterium]